jgi:hypothetical protein
VTDLCGNTATPVTRTVTWKTDLVKPVIVASGTTLTLGCNPSSAVINAALGTATATDNCDGTLTPTFGDSAVTGTDCNKSQTRTWNVTDLCGNTATPVTRTVTWKSDLTPPALQVPLTDLIFKCKEPVIIPVPSFVDNCDGAVSYTCSVTGVPGANCSTYKYPLGDTQVCFTAVDGCGNTTSVCIKVTIKPCDEFCTYTQGKYGNQGKSKSCILAPDVIPTSTMVIGMLAQGDLKIGTGSNYILFKAGDANIINNILPGGGGCGILNGICVPSTTLSCLNPYLTKQGRLNSGLIAQTLTLGLNLRINDDLGELPLIAGKWLTTQKKLSCEKGTGVVEMVCTPIYGDIQNPTTITGYTMTVNPYSYTKLPEGVLCYMASKGYAMTVQGLYNLANDALGQARTFPADVTCGTNTYTVNYCDIQGAVDLINNVFDECRLFVGYLDAKFACPVLSKAAIGTTDTGTNSLMVYPNPFNETVTFEFVSPKDANAVLDIQNVLGQRVTTLMNKAVKEGIVNKVIYHPADQVPGILIYRLLLDNSVQTGKIIYNRGE